MGLRALVQYRYDLPFVLSQPSPEFVVVFPCAAKKGNSSVNHRHSCPHPGSDGTRVQVPGESVSHRAGIVGQQNNPSLVREHLPLEPVRVLVPVSGFSERYSLRYRYR